MVSEGLAASRPGVSARLIVDVDDEFTHDHSVCKGNDSRVTFEFTVYYEPRYQTFMNSTHIADRIPNKFPTSLDFNFFVDRSHRILLRPLIEILTPWWLTAGASAAGAPETTQNYTRRVGHRSRCERVSGAPRYLRPTTAK